MLESVWGALTRKKPLAVTQMEQSNLLRALGLIDLTALGVGSTLGMGVYIMIGAIAKMAGPGAVLSFFIAGVAAGLSAFCYGEFAARVPKAGSAYVYSYVTIGEFLAFIVGWNLVLECVIGTACVARGLSNYLDNMIDERISKFLLEHFPLNVPHLSSYADLFSFCIVMVVSCILSFGVLLSSNINKLFTIVNLTTIVMVICAGFYKANFKNWLLTPSDIPHDKKGGAGGFLPFGVAGVFGGAAKCFYAYTGFDCVTTTGEEAKDPQRLVPLALVLTLFIAFLAYLGIACSLTLMLPYYDQSVTAPFSYAFEKAGFPQAKWIISVGALCALCACLVSSFYGTSRIIYSMASDGLLFKFLSIVNAKTQTPVVATVAVGLLTGVVTIFCDMEMLVDMTSIGTLTAYTIVSICILLLRYTPENNSEINRMEIENNRRTVDTNNSFLVDEVNTYASKIVGYEKNKGFSDQRGGDLTLRANHLRDSPNKRHFFKAIFNLKSESTDDLKEELPTIHTWKIVQWMTGVLVIASVVLCVCFPAYSENSNGGKTPLFEFIVEPVMLVALLIILFATISIGRQPQANEKLTFKVRFVPLIPVLSFCMNLLLMMMLNLQTWLRFLIWLIIGLAIYFGYSMKHSDEAKLQPETVHHKSRVRISASVHEPHG